MSASFDKSSITCIGIHIAPANVGVSQATYTAQVEKLIDASLRLPTSRGLQRYDIFSPNEDLAEVANTLHLDPPPVCVVVRGIWDSEESLAQMLTDPELHQLMLAGESFGFNHDATVFIGRTTNYVDNRHILIGKHSTQAHAYGIAIVRVPSSSDVAMGAELHARIKSPMQSLWSVAATRENVLKYDLIESSGAVKGPSSCLGYRPAHGTLISLCEVEDASKFTAIVADPAVSQIIEKALGGPLVPNIALECWAFGGNCITKRGGE